MVVEYFLRYIFDENTQSPVVVLPYAEWLKILERL